MARDNGGPDIDDFGRDLAAAEALLRRLEQRVARLRETADQQARERAAEASRADLVQWRRRLAAERAAAVPMPPELRAVLASGLSAPQVLAGPAAGPRGSSIPPELVEMLAERAERRQQREAADQERREPAERRWQEAAAAAAGDVTTSLLPPSEGADDSGQDKNPAADHSAGNGSTG